jgi:hypothetical protein
MRFIGFRVQSSKIMLAASLGAVTLMPLLPTWADAPPVPSQSTPNKPVPSPSSPSQSMPQATQPAPTARRFEGEVEKYLLNREGIVDGLVLNNGVQVKFPPQLSKNLMENAAVGDGVIVIGSAGTPNALGQEVQAESITNRNTERTVSTMVNYSNISVEGTAQRWLIGKQGEIRGVLLSNGAQVEFSPRIGNQLGTMAKPGARIQAQGVGISNDYGQVLEASNLTVDGQAIDVPAPTPGPKEKRPDRPNPGTTNRPAPSPDATAMPRPALPLN